MPRAQVIEFTSKRPADQQALALETELVARALEGDREAFRHIVESHKQTLFRVAVGVVQDAHLAEDVVQEAFVKAYRALDTFRRDARLATWLHRITLLTAIDFRRKQQSASCVMVDDQQLDIARDCGDARPASRAEAGVHAEQTRRCIEQAIQLLSPLEKSVFTLRHLQDFKLKEISEIVSRSEGTVKNVLFRAIRKLRQHLADADETINDMIEMKRW
jgi:RNA polymerase sigma-70 factor (ECF subfamily)